MMLGLLQKRRSIRKFQSKPVEREKLELLLEAVLRAPSSRGRNPWEFIIVTDPVVLERLSRAKEHGSEFLKETPLAVVVAGDPEISDVWVEDCAIAAIILHLTAESLGLGSCWVQIRQRMHGGGRTSEDYLREILDLPPRFGVAAIIGVGYPAEKKEGHPKDHLQYEKIHMDGFSC
jgi:nitroreductase